MFSRKLIRIYSLGDIIGETVKIYNYEARRVISELTVTIACRLAPVPGAMSPLCLTFSP
jgi:hypothetical protein